MASVAIIYDEHLTGLRQVRLAMKKAMNAAGLVPVWQEWRRGVPACPPHKPYSKVVVLADGKDVTTGFENLADCCVPPWQPALKREVEKLQCVLDGCAPAQLADKRGRGWAANLPAIVVALMPKFTCPLCLPLYSSVLSLFGLGFLKQPKYMLMFTIIVLLIALVNLAVQCRRRSAAGAQSPWFPFGLGAAGATVFVVGKFALDQSVVAYGGLLFFMAGCFWISWSIAGWLPALSRLVRGRALTANASTR